MRCATTRKQEVDPDERSHTKNKESRALLNDTKQRWIFITSWVAALCLCTRMQATKKLTTSIADVSLQLIPSDVNSSISLASSQNSCDFKIRSSFLSAPHPVAGIVSAPHLLDIASFVICLVCRKRTAELDPKRIQIQALDDCARYFKV